MRPLIAFLAAILAQTVAATTLFVPSVELRGAATETADGFRIQMRTEQADGKAAQNAP